ncbi:Copper-sensing transcriptional repressor CsoR [Pseudovibrio sp. Ad46]|uniref:metal-sensing transcriptional repressor n=1 Tax=unclassified Pseudovibrio TaxID=2627060 RepID=UPI0007112294|nr:MULTISPECIES: metal-sensing transcriptional repressor [unclassified Pseudovibrio]KZK94013.1 Copper-sensing transcriptional repressor CsoR [Pseudovibrio sp. Ad46]
MTEKRTHQSHPGIVNRLKRADGHLKSIIGMIEDGRPCVEIAQQLHAVEKAVMQAKKTLIYDHLDHCLDDTVNNPDANSEQTIEEFKAISRYL